MVLGSGRAGRVVEVSMDDTVIVQISVSRTAAEALRTDARRREMVGRIVSRMVQPDAADEDPLMRFLDSLPRDPDAPELTPQEIDAEIAASRAERRR
jgi:hypothetical protein